MNINLVALLTVSRTCVISSASISEGNLKRKLVTVVHVLVVVVAP